MSNNLFNRVHQDLIDRRQRILDGKINCIPWGLPRFEMESPGIEQGKYYLFTANSKVGKTQGTDWFFLFNTVKQVIDNNLNIRLKIFYFSLEMTKEEKMRSAFSNILYLKEGIRVSSKDLRSTKADNIIDEHILKLLLKYKPYFDKIEEIVTFIDDIRHPTGIFKVMEEYAERNGTTHYKTIINNQNKEIKTFDYYEANDPDEYVMCIIDHIGLIDAQKFNGKQLDLRESIGVLSSNYLVKLRNRYNQIPVVIQQQASSQESVENAKANKLKPTLDGLGENKTTQRDANLIFGLFSPYRHDMRDYFGYNIMEFKDNIRFLEIIVNREGESGIICPLFFDGCVNFFKELPKPDETGKMKIFKEKLNQIRNKLKYTKNDKNYSLRKP